MSRRRRSLELRQPGDTAEMRLAINWCLAQGYPVRRCSPSQLRVGPINFWPNSGTINFEASPAAPSEGLAAFSRMVTTWSGLSEYEQEEALQTLGEFGVNAMEKLLNTPYLL